jgi:hypothetical protein
MTFRPLALALSVLVCLAPLTAPAHFQSTHDDRPSKTYRHVPAPAEALGFTPGDDRKLASWSQVVEYFRDLARNTDRLRFEELGNSTMHNPLIMATISAPENLARLDEYKRIQQLLADPRQLGTPSDRDRRVDDLVKRGKTIVLITCGVHSTEVGSYLSSMLIAYRLASSADPEIQNILQNTIILLVPALNPDGVDIVKNWYDKTLGTPYEGTTPPEIYHKYVGHDDNRDWYAFTQIETQLVVDKIHNVWHPQIVHDIHQHGAFSSRLFLPPYAPPVEPNVPPQIVSSYTDLGNFMAREMRRLGFEGITTNSTYDAWSPSRAYSHYHGGVRILSETASCKIASPVTVKFNQLKAEDDYDPQKESLRFAPVWHGGEWHLRDITSYMTTAAFLLLRHASEHRTEWLQRFYEIGKESVRPRSKGELFAFVIPFQFNPIGRLASILRRGGVEVDSAKAFSVGRNLYLDGALIVRMDQPYGAFAKALLETQKYPDLRDSKGDPISPYDATAHSLAMLLGVVVKPIYAPFQYRSRPLDHTTDFEKRFDVGKARVAIYRSNIPAIDEGWTRWVVEKVGVNYSSVGDKEIRSGEGLGRFTTIIIPDQAPKDILYGHQSGTMPPEYSGGLGDAGVKSLREFVTRGGTIVFLNRASRFAIEQFKLPLRDVVAGTSENEFFAPGSILRIDLDTKKGLAAGMPKETIAWVEDSPVFQVIRTNGGIASSAVNVIARYPLSRDPLLSGWLLGGNRIRGKAALVEVSMGKGRIILFGFRPQYRGQSEATYPLFFNAIANR